MLTEAHLESAVSRGIISADQVAALKALAAPEASFEGGPEERFRIANGFNEVFVALGVLVLGIGMMISFSSLPDAGQSHGQSAALAFGYTAVLWLLAEYVTRRKRLLAPSIVTAAFIVWFAAAGGAAGSDFVALTLGPKPAAVINFGPFETFLSRAWTAAAATTAATVAAMLHYWRFRLPFSLLLIAFSAAGAVISVLAALAPELVRHNLASLGVAMGILIFLAAMALDFSDPSRATIRGDGAFWLHMAAAPILVHSLVSLSTAGLDITIDAGEQQRWATAVLVIFLVLALVAIIVDRRAILVAALGYLMVAIGYLVSNLGVTDPHVLFITPLIIGASVIVLGIGWQTLRRRVWRILPPVGGLEVLRPRDL